MYRKTLLAAAAAAMTAGLVACGGSSNDADDTPTPGAVGNTIALTASGRLISFDRATPGTLVGTVTVSGLASGESLLGIDVRPADGRLYAVSSAGRVYTVDPSTGVATLAATLAADATDLTLPFAAIAGTRLGVDFNPTVDRLRVVTNSGQNLRINVDTGATTTDGLLTLAGGASVSAAAYTNSFDGATATQLWVLNGTDNRLYLQNPPNDGVLAGGVELGVTVGSDASFDIDATSNVGVAAFTAGATTTLYSIDLAATAAAATAIGVIGGGEAVIGLALNDDAPVASALGLTTDNRLLAFNPRTPNTIASSTAITGLGAGETVVGIDIRPANDLLYALSDAGVIYTVDAGTGAATTVATLSNNAGMVGAGGAFTALAGTRFSVDFNPVADRLRVISETGQSLRINVDNGLTIVDGAINRTGVAASVVAAAYTNSFGPSPRTAPPAVGTALYNLETNSDVLTLQSPPNDGTLVNVGTALGVDAGAAAGFDIAGSANGLVLAAIGAGPATLYQVNLSTGAATLPRGLTADTARIGGASGVALLDLALHF